MKAKIVTEPFVPTPDEEFYYKPSEKWNYLVWCDKKYVGYFIRVYGEIPPRINPVKLNLIDENDQVILSDFKIGLSEDTLEGILNKDGKCSVQMKKDGVYILKEKCLDRNK